MLSNERIETHRKRQAAYRAAAKRELAAWWRRVDTSDAVAARDALIEFMEYLTVKYGESAAAAAADFYDDARATVNSRAAYRAVLAEPTSRGTVESAARYAVAPLFGAEPDDLAALSRASVAVGRWVKNVATETMYLNASRDPDRPRVVRVPRGDDTCAFCIMLASRGGLDDGYSSSHTARHVSVDQRKRGRHNSDGLLREFHDDCDCEPVTIFPGDPNPPGWDIDVYASMYESGAGAAGTRSDTSAILAAMREMHGLH